ncbi:hypothetical protein ISCGN_026633 [Ixodes scapularis]
MLLIVNIFVWLGLGAEVFGSSPACGVRGMSGGSGATSRGLNTEIVGGMDATPLEFPWQISLRLVQNSGTPGQHFCGGSIINKQHILTAAHCILEGYKSASYYAVVVGDQKLDTVDPNEKTFSVQSYTIHPKWNRRAVNYDYAILKLKTPLDFSGAQKALMPICLPRKNQVFDNQICTASGWGYLKDQSMGGGTASNVLQKVDLPTVPYKECKNDYKNVNTVVEKTMICAGPKEGGKSACQDNFLSFPYANTGTEGATNSATKAGFWWLSDVRILASVRV